MGSFTQLRGDEAQLYEQYATRLERTVTAQVHASTAVIEDACANAWLTFLRCQPARKSAWPWLKVVAVREAWRLSALERRTVSTDSLPSEQAANDRVSEHAEFHAELDRLARELDHRKRQILMLSAIGFTYAEIAEITGDSLRTVERQLLRARRVARDGR